MTAWSQIHADGGVASQKFVDDERVFLGFVTTGAMVANVRFVSVSHVTGSGGEGFSIENFVGVIAAPASSVPELSFWAVWYYVR